MKKRVTSIKDKKVTIICDPAKTTPEQLQGLQESGLTTTDFPAATDGAAGTVSQQR